MKVKSVDMENGVVTFDGPGVGAREVYCRACKDHVQVIQMGASTIQGCPRATRGHVVAGIDYGCDLELGGKPL